MVQYSGDVFNKIVLVGEDGIEYQNTFWDDIRVALTTFQQSGSSTPTFKMFNERAFTN